MLLLFKLGCGVGLCGMIAAKCGANVIFTDKRDVLELCSENCIKNGVNAVDICYLEWGVALL